MFPISSTPKWSVPYNTTLCSVAQPIPVCDGRHGTTVKWPVIVKGKARHNYLMAAGGERNGGTIKWPAGNIRSIQWCDMEKKLPFRGKIWVSKMVKKKKKEISKNTWNEEILIASTQYRSIFYLIPSRFSSSIEILISSSGEL